MKQKSLLTSIICTMALVFLSHIPNAYADNGYSFGNSMEEGYISMDLKKWMSAIPNEAPLSTLSIPGTHDSMALYDGASFGYAKDQSASLSTQLEKGIRYIDIRIRDTDDAFAIHHGIVFENAMFGDVLNMVTSFLKSNPTETVIMRVKNEHEQDINRYEKIFQTYWDAYKSYFWNPTSSNPKLGEIRGKIVVLQDFPSKTQFGIPYSNLDVEDAFDNVTYESKWNIVWNRLDNLTLNRDPNKIYLSHFSANTPNDSLTGKPSGYAEFINPRGITYLKENKYKTFTGIIAADFPDTVYTQSILYKNYLYYSLPTDKLYSVPVNMDICTKQDYAQTCVENMDPSYRTHEMYETINRLVEEDTLNEKTNWSGKSSYNFIRFNYIILPGQEKGVLDKLNTMSRETLKVRDVLKALNGYHNNTNTITEIDSANGVPIFPPVTLRDAVYRDQVNNYPTWVELGVYNKFKVISQHNPKIWKRLEELGVSLNDQTKEVIMAFDDPNDPGYFPDVDDLPIVDSGSGNNDSGNSDYFEDHLPIE
ncbi:phosphatidylinositol-specific phospholipase C [Bacillus sp. FSL K6-0268]|uniref:phosphatidylinositol-specific phospholipase C n=1 Tax=Bacillus sp. FSL K6-0268 TaxID=2921449 RepID=UPI0030F91EA9